jgi:hypothetical protein
MRSLRKEDLFQQRLFSASKLPDDWRKTFEIEVARLEELQNGDKKTEKLVVYFKGVKSGLVINATIFDQIAEITGEDDASKWGGFRITLFRSETQFQGRMVPCIRCSEPDAPPKKPAKKSAPKKTGDDDDKPPFNDSIEF